MAIVIAATVHSQWQALAPWLETAAGASADWERNVDWYEQAGATLPDGARVLILHCRPEHAIANAMQLGTVPEAALQQWQDTTAAILAFYRRNRRRTTLIEVPSALRHPEKLAEHLALHLEQPLQAPEDTFPTTETPSLLMQALAAQMVAQAPELAALMSEAEASTLPLDEQTWQPVPVDITALAAQLDAEKQEQERQAANQAQQLDAARQEVEAWQQRLLTTEKQTNKQLATAKKKADANRKALTAARQEADASKKALAAAQAQAKKRTDELTQALDAARQETATWQNKLPAAEAEFKKQIATLQQQQQANEQSLAETREENELLLLQLHQVQEELETTFLKAQANGERLKQIEGEHTKLQAELKAEKARSADQQKALDAARQETATWQKKLPAAEAKIKQQLADLTKARDAAAAETQAARQELKALQEQHTRSEQKLADTTEENELLLLQLHQVQEELETTFLRAQEDASKLRETEQNLREAEQNLQTAQSEIAALGQKIQELEKSPFRRTFAPLQALARPRGKRKSDKSEKRKLEQDIALIQSSGLFNAEWYLKAYPDVAKEGVDPLEHYLRYGAAEGRNPSTAFATEFYLNMNPDVREAAMNPLLHYIKFGRQEGRLPKG